MTTTTRLFGTVAPLLLLFAAGPARADLEQIIVTATKRAENPQDIPMTVHAIGGEELQKQRVDAAEDVLSLFANLTINGSNEVNKGFTIRGVGTNNFHGNINQAVGVYRDDVSSGTPFSATLGVFDVERVEVLRGPQNTLFGRNTTGGTINYVSRRPTIGESTGGYLQGTVGEDNEFGFEAAVGFGLGGSAAGRLALQSVSQDGLFINMAPGREGEKLGKRDRQSARAQLSWQAGTNTLVLFNAHVGYVRGSNIGNKAIGLRDPVDPSLPCNLSEIARGSDYQTRNDCAAENGFNPSSAEWQTVYNASGAQRKIDVEGGFVRVKHGTASGLTLTTITAVEHMRVNQVDDSGGYNEIRLTPTQDGDYDQFSQELRLASPDDSNLRWLAGFYFFREEMLLGTNVVNNGPGVIASNILEQTDRDRSVYGQLDFDVSSRVALGLGLRYTDNEKSAPSSVFRIVPRLPNGLTDPTLLITNEIVEDAAIVPVTIRFENLRADLNKFGGNLYASYRPNENTHFYVSYSEGFKSGGFDTRSNAALTPGSDVGRPVGPEFLEAWEAGVKSRLADGNLQLNAAAFAYEWKDLQSFIVVGGVPGFSNIPESELYGLEMEVAWTPADDWSVNASIGLLRTEVTDSGNLGASVDEGHELPNSPGFSAKLAAQKDFTLNSGWLSLRADLHFVDEQKDTFLFANDPYSTKGSTSILNASAAYTFGPEDRYEVRLWGEDLSEARFCYDIGLVDNPTVTAGQLSSTGACSPSPGQRRFGLAGRLRF